MHSPKQKEQKESARAEALEHMKSSVMHPRDGMQHEDHKEKDASMNGNSFADYQRSIKGDKEATERIDKFYEKTHNGKKRFEE